MLQDAVRVTTKAVAGRSYSRGEALLREEPFSKDAFFQYAVRGYTDAMGPGTDWRRVREELDLLVQDRSATRTLSGGTITIDLTNPVVVNSGSIQFHSGQNQVDRTIAARWASHDLDAAVNWYARELSDPQLSSADPSSLTVTVLRTVPAERGWEVVDWIDRERFEDGWSDRVVVEYAKQTAMQRDYEIAEQLVAMPVAEADRVAIVAAYATPHVQNNERRLRHSPENIQRLIDAANLSEDERGIWMDTVAGATWK